MVAKVLSLLGALVITGATVLVTAEPAHATPSGDYHHQVAAVRGYHHGGHDGRYYGGYRHYRPYDRSDRYPYRPYYGGYRYPYRPYYHYDPYYSLRR
jgi:hypothetical protein